eukprot:scaffold87717_cov64-Phaeocystis_antarctica.AAC.5
MGRLCHAAMRPCGHAIGSRSRLFMPVAFNTQAYHASHASSQQSYMAPTSLPFGGPAVLASRVQAQAPSSMRPVVQARCASRMSAGAPDPESARWRDLAQPTAALPLQHPTAPTAAPPLQHFTAPTAAPLLQHFTAPTAAPLLLYSVEVVEAVEEAVEEAAPLLQHSIAPTAVAPLQHSHDSYEDQAAVALSMLAIANGMPGGEAAREAAAASALLGRAAHLAVAQEVEAPQAANPRRLQRKASGSWLVGGERAQLGRRAPRVRRRLGGHAARRAGRRLPEAADCGRGDLLLAALPEHLLQLRQPPLPPGGHRARAREPSARSARSVLSAAPAAGIAPPRPPLHMGLRV